MRLFNRLPVIALFFTLLLLVACSSGGGDGTTSFTVSTSAGANGAISPASTSVNQNETTRFTVTPDTGYLIDVVSGCGGSLSGDTYTTGVITADCTVLASFIERTLGPVSALFPTSAANWNDYVAGHDWSTATDFACAAVSDSACLHGGEHRLVEATGRADCTGLSAADDLAAFNWVCDDSSGTARLISTGLTDGKYLSDLIDFNTPGFRPNAVTIFENGIVWGMTSSSTWWTNPVTFNNSGGSLDSESTIYLVTSDPASKWTLDADKLALVIQPGVTVPGPGASDIAISASNMDYLWLEGAIDASGDGIGVNLSTVRFSVLRRLSVNNTPLGIVLINNSIHNRLIDVTASNNSIGINLLNASNNNTLSGLATSNNSVGVRLDTASNNTLSGLASVNNSIGVSLTDGSNNRLSDLTVSNSQTGVLLDTASYNTFMGVTTTNNSDGVLLDNASTSNGLSAVAAANNNRGIRFENASNSNAFSELAVGNNDVGIYISISDDNTFTGLLEAGSNNNDLDCLVIGGTNPGLTEPDCAAIGASDHTLISNISLTNAFVGKLISDDVLNASDTDGAASYPADPVALAAFDWAGFDNAYRGWGIDGSDFPSVDHQGQWTTGAGRIWDWSVSSGDTGNDPFAALLAVFTVPTGNETLTHPWNGTPASNDNAGCDLMVAGSVWNSTASICETTFLRHAVEIQADGLGNDNTLCESGEICLYTPNIGSYQGHGDLISAGTITAGTLSGITLMRYDSNGR